MNLILQAIKSLFRNVHVAIRDLNNDVENAQTAAKNANKKAMEAKNAADKTSDALDAAVTESKRVLHATISGSTAVVQDAVTLENGLIYTLIPDADCNSYYSSYAAAVNVNGETLNVVCGVTNMITHSGKNRPEAGDIYRKDLPVLLMYDASKKQFQAITKENVAYITVSNDTKRPTLTEYVVMWDSQYVGHKVKYMRVRSSTAGSTKLFDIQVDDSGTITAVEVTE